MEAAAAADNHDETDDADDVDDRELTAADSYSSRLSTHIYSRRQCM